MVKSDFDQFDSILNSVCSLLTRGTYTPTAENTAIWFRALAKHDIESVRLAFDAHVRDPQRGKFAPVPADILYQIGLAVADDGRPGSEEAWPIALSARDENATIVWTVEIARAWSVAKPVMDVGDEVGARMAFRQAYDRLVSEAREAFRPAEWSVTLGFDPEARRAAVQRAVELGRLPPPRASDAPALPPPRAPISAVVENTSLGAKVSEMLTQVRARLAAGMERRQADREAAARRQAEELQALKNRTADAVDRYKQGASK